LIPGKVWFNFNHFFQLLLTAYEFGYEAIRKLRDLLWQL
jgi:hypothetical protein